MKTVKFYESKNKTYVICENEGFQLHGTLVPFEIETIKARVGLEFGWEILEAASMTEAVTAWYALKAEKKAKREVERAEFDKKMDIEREKENQEIIELIKQPVIEANPENIKLVLKHLNSQNWGSWHLPTLSIGYSANQYDCDGSIATTIQLVESIEVETWEGKKKLSSFKVGGRRGHLEKYYRL